MEELGKMTFKMMVVSSILLLLCGLTACQEPVEKIQYDNQVGIICCQLGTDPVFKQGRFKVYTLYRPQVQYHDFNGIFDIAPGWARVVRKFWKERFNELTRPGHYGEFFLEFFDYASSFAQSYPVANRKKEIMIDTLERSFHDFCMVLNVAEAFEAFQKKQQKIYGD